MARTLRTAAVCASVASTLVAGAASAEDTTLMPGSACKHAGYQAADTMTQSFGATFANAGSGPIPATCPIARALYDSQSLEYAAVLVSGGVGCSLVLMSTTGETTMIANTSTQSVGDKTLLQWALGDANIPVYNPGAYAFQCSLPGQGLIYYYQIDENQGGDD